MARRGHAYPQVEPRAADLMDRRVVKAPGSMSVGKALGMARAAGARVVTDRRAAACRKDLERAASWGFGGWRWFDIARVGLPSVTDETGEIAVRRLLQDGAPAVLVRDGRRAVGVVEPAIRSATSAGGALTRLERLEGRHGEARFWLLRTAGKLAEAQGQAVYAVGGLVRDLFLGLGPARIPDVDLVVEGDGIAFARRLAKETGGHLVVHVAFGTATLEGGAPREGSQIGRVDIASARRERYDAPGALPAVSPASILEDLGRRDFSVNAMAVALAPSTWGRLLDPFGGRLDLVARRLRVLHPLSLVEDPTRIFRGARYAVRVGLKPDAGFRQALALAWKVAEYPALSGQRLRTELDLIMDEPDPWSVLGLLLGWRAMKLWDPGFRVTRRSRGRLRAARRLAAWAQGAGVAVEPGRLALCALLVDQPRSAVERCLRRLAVTGVDATQLDPVTVRSLARRLGAASELRPSRCAALLRPAPDGVVLGAWLCGGRRARGRIEWFLGQGRGERPLSSGDELIAAGVPRGPRVAQALAQLRDLRLDGRVRTKDDERAALADWIETLTRKGESG